MNKIISSSNAPKSIGPYSQAVLAGNTLYISGQLPVDPKTGSFVPGDVKEQTEQVLKNIGAILKEAGFSFGDVVKSTCLLNDINNFADINEVYGKYYSKNPPARAAYEVVNLPLGALIEIETIAVK